MSGGSDDDWLANVPTDDCDDDFLPDPFATAPQDELDIIASYDWLPVPHSLGHLNGREIHKRYVIGTEPIPDLAAAEYIRRQAQFLALEWIRQERAGHERRIVDVRAEAVRHREANFRAASIWVIAKGDLNLRGLVKRAVEAIDVDEGRAIKFGWPAASTREQRDRRARKVAQLVKDLRRAVAAGEEPFLLSNDDLEHVRSYFDLDDFEVEAEDF